MFKRRLIFSILYFVLALSSVLLLDTEWIFLILIPAIPFLFYFINIFDLKIPAEYEMVFLVFITFGTVLGELWDFYYTFSLFDSILHCLAGPILSLIPLCMLVRSKIKVPFKTKWLIVLLVSMGFAALWECHEFTMDTVFGFDMQKDQFGNGLEDTMHDLWIHLIGTLGFIIFVIFDELKFKGKYTKKIEAIMERETTEKIKVDKKKVETKDEV